MRSSLIWVTASKPINAKTYSGEKIFQPGEAFQVNPFKAKPLIEKNILKEVTAYLEGLAVGSLIEWKSPIFGPLSGRVEMIPGDGTVVVNHPLTEELASIPLGWVKQSTEKD